jgi:rhodanese-related sulfurtransferase
MDEQTKHYQAKLDYEIDPFDLKQALDRGEQIVVIDTRQPASYAQRHIPGAINLPHGTMSAETTSHLDKRALVITYCDGIGCNGSTKGALNMHRLGFRVKEMMGGIEWWLREGLETHGTESAKPTPSCNC